MDGNDVNDDASDDGDDNNNDNNHNDDNDDDDIDGDDVDGGYPHHSLWMALAMSSTNNSDRYETEEDAKLDHLKIQMCKLPKIVYF